MKYLFYSLLSFILCFCLSACANIKSNTSASDVSSLITCEIEKLEGVENFSDETIKTLGVLMNSNYENNKNISTRKNKHTSARIYDIVSTLKNEEPSLFKQTFIFDKKNDWLKEISKAEILMFLADKKISLATISDIKPVYENKVITGVNLGGTVISAEEIIKRFDLPSANVYNIEDKKTKVLISGVVDENAVNINPKKLEELSKSGKKSDEILKTLKNDFYLITKNK